MMNTSNTDFFLALTQDGTLLGVCLTFAMFVSIILPVFLYSVIWYEKHSSDNKQTLLNKFETFVSWSGIEYLTFVQMAENVRYLVGPLPAYFCLFVRILRSTIFVELLVYLDLAVLTRYFYIFWIKNPAGFQDDFWAMFLNMMVKMFCLLSMIVWHLAITYQPLNFYICAGIDPTLAYLNPPRYKTNSTIEKSLPLKFH